MDLILHYHRLTPNRIFYSNLDSIEIRLDVLSFLALFYVPKKFNTWSDVKYYGNYSNLLVFSLNIF